MAKLIRPSTLEGKANDISLFLLEVLVDKIKFNLTPCFADKDFKTCVRVSFPVNINLEPLIISDDEACTARGKGFTKNFNIGKSVLFVLPKHDIQIAMSTFILEITVYKTLPCECLPTRIVLGVAKINFTKEFVQSRQKYFEDPTCVSCVALGDSFSLLGSDGSKTGEINMYIRISCFGKLIVTKFQGTGGSFNLGSVMKPAGNDRSCEEPCMTQVPNAPCACGMGSATRSNYLELPCDAGICQTPSFNMPGLSIRYYNKIPEQITDLPEKKLKNYVKQTLCRKAYYKLDQYLTDKDATQLRNSN